MVCRRCSGQPRTPVVRAGYPTIHAYGPFPGHEPVVVTPPQEDPESE